MKKRITSLHASVHSAMYNRADPRRWKLQKLVPCAIISCINNSFTRYLIAVTRGASFKYFTGKLTTW